MIGDMAHKYRNRNKEFTMANHLVIVESPAKVKTIKKFLGSNYEVDASGGHVRDLPKSQLGFDPEHDYEPKYITIRGKGDVLAKLRKEVKKQKVGIIADWKMSEAVQAEICGLNEALEGSESKISWCIYRRKEQDIVERMKKETKADALVVLDAGILEEFGEQAENGTYEGAELYGVGYSLKTIALLDNGNIQGLAVPDGYEIGYKSVEEITKRIKHRFYKMQGYITEYQVLGKENFSMDEDLERFLYSYE